MKKVMMMLMLGVMGLFVCSCATTQPTREKIWVAATTTGQDIPKDQYQCKQDAATFSGAYSQAGSSYTSSARRSNFEQHFNHCMIAKGYVLEDKEDFLRKLAEVESVSKQNKCKIGASVSMADGIAPKIIKIAPDSPAEKGGLKEGGIIKKVEETTITSGIHILKYRFEAGKAYKFTVDRGGFARVFTVIPEKVE